MELKSASANRISLFVLNLKFHWSQFDSYGNLCHFFKLDQVRIFFGEICCQEIPLYFWYVDEDHLFERFFLKLRKRRIRGDVSPKNLRKNFLTSNVCARFKLQSVSLGLIRPV